MNAPSRMVPQKEPWTGVRRPGFQTRLTTNFTSLLWGLFVTPLTRIHNSVPAGRAAEQAEGCSKEEEGWGPRRCGPNHVPSSIAQERKNLRLIQDGGVEGPALTPSCESTRITTNSWTIIDRKTLELTKKDTPHPKTKEKPQWDSRRGAITIKSNPTTAGWLTHKLENTYTSEVHPLEWRFWAPCQVSQPGGPATGGGIPRESNFED